jgi:crossover junction endodeoxyribonuclease RusA
MWSTEMTESKGEYTASSYAGKVTITLPWPDRAMSPNARSQWGRIRAVSPARDLARLNTLDQVGQFLPLAQPKNIILTLDYYPPKGRRADWDNVVGLCKAYQDGIFDALRWSDAAIVDGRARKHAPSGEGEIRYNIWEGEGHA